MTFCARASGSSQTRSRRSSPDPIEKRKNTMALNEREQALLDRVETGLAIGGKWEASASGATFDVRDPATGEVIKTIADATVEDAVRALEAAVEVQDSWAAVPSRERSNILRRAFDLLTERKED